MTEPLTLRDLDAIGVERIKGVGEKKLASLHDVGIDTVLDLLTTYPRRWVDRTNEARVSDLLPGQEALVLVSVRSVTKRSMRNRRTMVNVVVGDGSGRLQVVFFNQPWREKQLREGLQVALFGKAEVYRGGLQMTNPVVDLIGDRTGRIVPVYPQSEKASLMTWEIAGWVEDALRKCSPRGIADPISDSTRRRYGLIGRGAAFQSIHAPDTIAEKEQARRRLAFDELLRVQTMLVMRKRMLERESKAIRHNVAGELTARLYSALPYRAHRRAAQGDRRDRERSRRSAPDAPIAAGRRRFRQDPGGGQRDADGRPGWSSGSLDGAHRGARRAARRRGSPDARRSHGSRPWEPVRGPSAAHRVADQSDHGRRTARRAWPGSPTAPSTSPLARTPSSRKG